MALDGVFNGKKIFTIVAMVLLLVGLIGDFIASLIWWNRIQPWFSHAKDEGKTVYQCTLACWVLSLIGVVAVIVFLIFYLFVDSICESITSNNVVLIICIVIVGGISVGSIISGAYGGSFALKNPDDDLNFEDIMKVKNKCVKYFFTASYGINEWIMKHMDKYNDYLKWSSDLAKHMVTKDGNYKWEYLCINVGIPTFFFALVQCVAIVLFIVAIIIG